MITREFRLEQFCKDIEKFKTTLSAEDLYRLIIHAHDGLCAGEFGALLYTDVEKIIFKNFT